MPSGKELPGKCNPENCLSPVNCSQENCPLGKLSPEKIIVLVFVAVDIIVQLFIFKLFIVSRFRGVSRAPQISMWV